MSEHTCQGKVISGFRFRICGRNAAYEDEGLWFCKTHHPPTVKAKGEARYLEWKKNNEAQLAKERQARDDKEEMKRKAAMYDELLTALDWISTVNAMDYEYQAIARAAIAKATGETK